MVASEAGVAHAGLGGACAAAIGSVARIRRKAFLNDPEGFQSRSPLIPKPPLSAFGGGCKWIGGGDGDGDGGEYWVCIPRWCPIFGSLKVGG